MIEEDAIVASVEGDRVWVEKARKSACGSCEKSCASSMVADYIDQGTVRLAVTSLVAVQPGDRVVVGIPENTIVLGSLGVYLLPLVGLLAGAMLGEFIGLSFMVPDFAAVFGGLAGLAGTLALLRSTSVLSRNAPQAVVLRKLG